MVLKVQNLETRRCVFAQIILITNSKWIFLTLGLILIGFRENHMQFNAYFEINRFLGKSDNFFFNIPIARNNNLRITEVI